MEETLYEKVNIVDLFSVISPTIATSHISISTNTMQIIYTKNPDPSNAGFDGVMCIDGRLRHLAVRCRSWNILFLSAQKSTRPWARRRHLLAVIMGSLFILWIYHLSSDTSVSHSLPRLFSWQGLVVTARSVTHNEQNTPVCFVMASYHHTERAPSTEHSLDLAYIIWGLRSKVSVLHQRRRRCF